MNESKILEVRKNSQRYAYDSLQLHETIARRAGFTGTDHKYLGYLLQRGALTAGELAALTGLTTGAITGLIDRFVKKKLVKRQYDKKDRRKVLVVPDTQKIMDLFAPYYPSFQAQTEELIGTFSESELEVINRYLLKSIALMQ